MIRCCHADTNTPKRTRAVFRLWDIPYGVARPYVLCDATAYWDHFRRTCREVGLATADLRELPKDSGIAIWIVDTIQPDGVNSSDALLYHIEHLPALMYTGIVASVRDHHERFLIASPQFQLL